MSDTVRGFLDLMLVLFFLAVLFMAIYSVSLEDVCVEYGGSLSTESCTFPNREVPLEVTE